MAAARRGAALEVSAPAHELRAEGAVLIDDATGLIWAAEPSELLEVGHSLEEQNDICRRLFYIPMMSSSVPV